MLLLWVMAFESGFEAMPEFAMLLLEAAVLA